MKKVVGLVLALALVAVADEKEDAKLEADLGARLEKIKSDATSRLEELAKDAEKAKRPDLAKPLRAALDQAASWKLPSKDDGVDFEGLCARWKAILDDSDLAPADRDAKLAAIGKAVKGQRTRVIVTLDEIDRETGLVKGRVGDFTLGLQFTEKDDLDRLKTKERNEKITVDGEIYVSSRPKDLPGIDAPRLVSPR